DKRHALRAAEDALDRADRALLVEVFLGFLAEGQGAVAAEGDDRGGPLLPLVIGDDLRFAVLKVRHDRIAASEVDTDVRHGAWSRSQGSGVRNQKSERELLY